MNPDQSPRFHLAFPVDDLAAARAFYVHVLGAKVGRSSDRWLDLDFFGHQITAHLAPAASPSAAPTGTNPVDGEQVPVRHFGVILDVPGWQAMATRLQAAGVNFLVEPQVRFQGQVGEQHTLFLLDPAGNGIEFKAFADDSQVFAHISS